MIHWRQSTQLTPAKVSLDIYLHSADDDTASWCCFAPQPAGRCRVCWRTASICLSNNFVKIDFPRNFIGLHPVHARAASSLDRAKLSIDEAYTSKLFSTPHSSCVCVSLSLSVSVLPRANFSLLSKCEIKIIAAAASSSSSSSSRPSQLQYEIKASPIAAEPR